MSQTAIIGAGMAGLAAAWELRRHDLEVTVFEKSRGLSGRAATRRRENACYDHGANFFRTSDPEIHDLVHHLLPTDDLVEIPGPIWTFDASGSITPGNPRTNALPKYTYRNGISNLGKLLVGASRPTIHRQTPVTRLKRASEEWFLQTDDGTEHGPFSQIILTPPAEQTANLLNTVDGQEETLAPLRSSLRTLEFHKQFSFILGFDHRLPRSPSYHALVSSDHQHDIAWLSHEEDKPGHVNPAQSIVVIQMAPAWSQALYDTAPEILFPMVLDAARTLLPELPSPAWWDSQRWRFAHPASKPEASAFHAAEHLGLFLAGDTLAGRGRIPLALKSGLQTAKRILENAPQPA